MKGMMLAIGVPKKKAEADEEEAPASEPAESSEKVLAREAYGAIKGGDEAGFIEAFLGAVRACKSKSYEADDDEG